MQLLTLENINSKDTLKTGVYRIYLFTYYNKPVNINRFIDSDDSGLIYIGSAQVTSIEYRLRCFIHSMDKYRKQNNHSAGKKICNSDNLRDYINKYQLMFNYEVKVDARDYERKLLGEQKEIYGELPPLNG